MNNLGKTKLYLELQIEHLNNDILVHQETYIENVFYSFYMDKFHLLFIFEENMCVECSRIGVG